MDTIYGRIKILSDLIPTGDIEQDKFIIPLIIENTLNQHQQNVCKMTELKGYYYNYIADLDSKNKTQQKSINNKIPINYPEIAVTTINSYCFAQPITFSGRTNGIEDKIKSLNDALDDDKYAQKSHDMFLNSAITALGYRYITPATKEQIANNIYFETHCNLDPMKTYCVYSNDLKQEKICAITYLDKGFYNKELNTITSTRVYTVFTKFHKWEFYKLDNVWTNNPVLIYNDELNDYEKYEAFPLAYQKIPIIECLRKADRTNDYELALGIINAINKLASSRLDDVQQAVDYILVLRDIDIWTEGAIKNIKTAIGDGILGFKSIEGATVQPSIDVLDTKLDQSQVQTLQNFLCEKLEEVLNIPSREARSSGGDTGSAVESRNGFRSLENIAGLVTSSALKCESETLDVILAMCKNIDGCPFKDLQAKDVEITDNRNRLENTTTAVNNYVSLRGANVNDVDAAVISGVTTDPQGFANRNKAYQEEKQNEELAIAQSTQSNSNNKNGSANNNGSANQ